MALAELGAVVHEELPEPTGKSWPRRPAMTVEDVVALAEADLVEVEIILDVLELRIEVVVDLTDVEGVGGSWVEIAEDERELILFEISEDKGEVGVYVVEAVDANMLWIDEFEVDEE